MRKQNRNIKKQLEYRKPKRVVEVVFWKQSNDSFAICPTCKNFIDREYMGFCSVCGQNLCWKAFDKAKIIYKE